MRDHAADKHEGHEAQRIGGERLPRRHRIGGGEGAAGEQRAHDQLRHDQESGDAGHGKQQRQFDGAVLRAARTASSPAAMRRAISGSTTVPAAMPMTPIGN